MNSERKAAPLRDRLTALLCGVGVTALLAVTMGWLNRDARARSERDPNLRRVLVVPPLPRTEFRRPPPPTKPRKPRHVSLDTELPQLDFANLDIATLEVPESQGDSEQTPMDAADADVPPRRVSGDRPRYPRAARRRGIEGAVRLRLLVDDHGVVRRAEVLETRGHEAFREAVLRAVHSWRFTPAFSDGGPVWVWASTTVRFELDD